MELVKFVKVTEKNKDEMARELGYESESDLLKDAEFETLVGLWIDTDEDMEVECVTGVLTSVNVVKFNNRNFGGVWYTTVYAENVDLLMVGPEVCAMSMSRYEQIFC